MASKKMVSFAEAFSELETIMRWFESGDPDLEAGLKKYERGLALAAACRLRLQEIENTVVTLKEQYEKPTSEEKDTLL